MALAMAEPNMNRILPILITIIFCILITSKYQNVQKNNRIQGHISTPRNNHRLPLKLPTIPSVSLMSRPPLIGRKLEDDSTMPKSLEYEYYRDTCPRAEQVIRSVVSEVNATRPDTVPSLLRLVFHDCFVEGCDASLLLDAVDGIKGEKETSRNAFLKGFDIVDQIKSEVEAVCPGVVSCADILVLAAREAVVLGGGPFYPLLTGRRDSTLSFPEVAEYDLPSSQDDLLKIIANFATRGFDDRETVALLGSHRMGVLHCSYFISRLYNFNGADSPDPSVHSHQFLNLMKSACDPGNNALSPPSSSGFGANDPETSVDTQILNFTAPTYNSGGNTPSPSPPMSSVGIQAGAPELSSDSQIFYLPDNPGNNAPSQLSSMSSSPPLAQSPPLSPPLSPELSFDSQIFYLPGNPGNNAPTQLFPMSSSPPSSQSPLVSSPSSPSSPLEPPSSSSPPSSQSPLASSPSSPASPLEPPTSSSSTSPSATFIVPPLPSADESTMEMDYKGPSSGFPTFYYRKLLENKGSLYANQQLTAGDETLNWVRVYAADARLFQQDFALTMMKLSNLGVLTAPLGQVRSNCRKVA